MVECHAATKTDKNVVCVHVWLRVHRIMEMKIRDQANEMVQGVRELVTKSDNQEFDPREPNRRESTPASCPLTSTCIAVECAPQ